MKTESCICFLADLKLDNRALHDISNTVKRKKIMAVIKYNLGKSGISVKQNISEDKS